MPTITLKFKDSVIGRYPIAKGKSLSIGRRKDNDIVIDNLAVSAHHAKIDSVGDAFVLVDLQSKNGSFVNEQIISSHWLKPGDAISIGKHLLLFGSEDDPNAAEAARDMDQLAIVRDGQTRVSRVRFDLDPVAAVAPHGVSERLGGHTAQVVSLQNKSLAAARALGDAKWALLANHV